MNEPTRPTTTQNYIASLQAAAPRDVIDLRLSMQFGDENKYVSAYFDAKKYRRGLEILHITDVQWGHVCCKKDRFLEYQSWVLSEPNRFVLFGGDLIDSATVLSIASPFDNEQEPQGQIYDFVVAAMPMRHRIIGYVGGNHERRGIKTFGDLGRLIATLLKIPYSSGKQFVDIYYGAHRPFRNSLWHGGGAARTKGAKAQMLHRFMQQADSQVYWVGHLHDTLMLGEVREKREKNQIKLEKYAGVMSSSFLEHYGTYAEVAGLSANDTQMWRLVLDPDGKWMLTLR